MKKLIGLMAFALLLSFGTATYIKAGDPAPTPTPAPTPAPTPTDEKDKKKPIDPKAFESEPKDEKKDDKGGK